MKNSIAENISINLFIKVFTYLFSFLTVMYVTRILQPSAFGTTAFASSVAGYFVMFASLGMPLYATRACAKSRSNRKDLSKTFNELWSINILLSAISLAAFAICLIAIPKLRENGLMLALYGTGIIFQAIGCQWLFEGLEKFRFLAISTLICKITSLLCIIAFVRSPEDVILYVVFSLITSYGTYLLCFIKLRRHVDISFRIRINKSHFKPLLVFFMMSCAVYVYSSLDITMLGFMKSDYETGLYSIAVRLKFILTLLGIVVLTSAMPRASELWEKGDRKPFESLAKKSLVFVGGIQFLLMAGCLLFSRLIIVITGGSSYLEAVPAFRILLFSLLPIGLSNIVGGLVLIPAGKENRLLFAEVAGAVLNFIANIIFIPKYSILAAASATVASEILVCILCFWYAKKDLGMNLIGQSASFAIGKAKTIAEKAAVYLGNLICPSKLPYCCPCCGKRLYHFRDGEFISNPEIYNPDRYTGDQAVICPICSSLPRHRILANWMAENTELLRNKRILYFAPEKFMCRWLKKNNISFTTADLYGPADLKIDIQDTKLDDCSYDIIICNHVLEHVEDYAKALNELHRLVSRDGLIIISFPVDLSLESVYEDSGVTSAEGRLKEFGQTDHLRVFGRDSAAMLESFGFDVAEIKGEDCDPSIKPVIGPADYDFNTLWRLTPK